MFHNKINKRIDQVENDSKAMDLAITQATTDVIGTVGGDVMRVRAKVAAMETYFGIKFNGESYAKAKELKVKKTK